MIAYKVVERRTRYGSNLALCKRGRDDWRGLRKFVEKYIGNVSDYQKILPYFPRYFKGALVKMAPGSVGLMVFKRELAAERFRWYYEGGAPTTFRIMASASCRLHGKAGMDKAQNLKDCAKNNITGTHGE